MNPLTSACALLMKGAFFSYCQLRSAILRIVIGMSIQPAVIPTARGNVLRRKRPRFLVMILPVIVATRTYIAPGRSCSPVSGLGAREAIVSVKEVSLSRTKDMKLLMPFSAARDWSCRNSRAFLTWPVRRSVGVGDVEDGLETGDVSEGFGFRTRVA